jgi:hypothetical protein
MGYEGKVLNPFAKLIKNLYDSRFAEFKESRSLKAAMGRNHEQFSGNQQ